MLKLEHLITIVKQRANVQAKAVEAKMSKIQGVCQLRGLPENLAITLSERKERFTL